MNNSASNIQASVQDLKHFCEQNFFQTEAQTIIFIIVGMQNQSSLINRIHPQDLLALNERNFQNLFNLIKFLRNSDKSIGELFGIEWLDSIYSVVP